MNKKNEHSKILKIRQMQNKYFKNNEEVITYLNSYKKNIKKEGNENIVYKTLDFLPKKETINILSVAEGDYIVYEYKDAGVISDEETLCVYGVTEKEAIEMKNANENLNFATFDKPFILAYYLNKYNFYK